MTWQAPPMPRDLLRPALLAVGVLVVAGYVTGLSWAAERLTYDVWLPMLLVPVLLLAGAALLWRGTAGRGDRWLFQVAVLALAVKLASGVLRYLMAYVLYEGSDASWYHDFGMVAYDAYRHLDFSPELPFGGIPGTGFLAAVAAAVYALTGTSITGGYVVFSFLGFWGQWLAFCGFRRAVPHGNHHRYALLVLFLPTLVFWPSALGKDAWMQLTIGVTLLGAGWVSAGIRPRGLAVAVAGLALAGLVRPHVAGILALGLVGGLVLQRPRVRTSLTPVTRVVAGLVLGAGAIWAATKGAAFVGAESLSVAELQGAVENAGGRTNQGGSEFSPTPLLSPLGPAAALVTVLFRPLPFDAHNAQALLASMESLLLLGLTWRWRSSLLVAVRSVRTSAFVAAALVAVLLFVAAFSEFANFGILARQRAQFLPMFLVLLCLPPLHRTTSQRSARPAATVLEGAP